jgi:glycosyltransferase involved in cell wall biosynthesis
MSKLAIHQIVPNMRSGDAIGNTSLSLQRVLQSIGFESEIFRESCTPDLEDSTRPAAEYLDVSSADNIVFFHYSIGSDLNRFVYNLPDNVVIIYHNITPHEYFVDIHNHVVGELYHGRKQLNAFASKAIMGLGDSEYNRLELEEAGFQNTDLLPLVVSFDDLDAKPDPVMMEMLDDHKATFLFVGRVVPNKALEDLIILYAHYKKYVSHDSRLIIAGDWAGFETYYNYLMKLAYTIDLPDFTMTGRVDFSQLIALYKSAAAYISTSQHEGFCLPLLEAMHFDIPVMALDKAAVAETMGGAGVLAKSVDIPEMAEMLNLMVEPGIFRNRLIEGQQKRLAEYKEFPVEDNLRRIIKRAQELAGGGK